MRPTENYEVFAARTGRDQPIRHVGNLRASDARGAAVYAQTMYDEWRWKAMFVVPRKALIFVKKAD